MRCQIRARVWAVANGKGAALQEPYNITAPSEVEEVRDFIQRALAAVDPSDLHLPPKLSAEATQGGRIIVNISLTRFLRWRRERKILRPALVVNEIADNLWEVDFEEDDKNER